MIPRASSGAASSESFSLCTATAETTLPSSVCSMISKSVVTSSVEYGSAFSIWMRTISLNSDCFDRRQSQPLREDRVHGQTRGRDCVVPFRCGIASSSVATSRTSQRLCSLLRRARHSSLAAAGIRKTGDAAVSISQLLPGDQLRSVASFADDHLHHARHVAGLPDADDAHHLILESDQRGKLFKLLGRKSKRNAHIVHALEVRIVFRAIDSIGSARARREIGRRSPRSFRATRAANRAAPRRDRSGRCC